METGSEESRGWSGDMRRWCIGDDQEFSGNVLEEDKGQRFKSITPKGGWEE